MKRIIPQIGLLGIMIFGLSVYGLNAQGPGGKSSNSPKTRAVSFSLSWAGITPSVTKDGDLVKKYGKGLWLENVGHTGGRAYLTSNKSVVLIAELHGDDIDSVTVASSNAVSLEIPHLGDVPIVKLFPNRASFGGVVLGDDRNTVYKALGPAAETEKSAEGGQMLTWEVNDSGKVDPAAGFRIEIREGHVTAFILYYGD